MTLSEALPVTIWAHATGRWLWSWTLTKGSLWVWPSSTKARHEAFGKDWRLKRCLEPWALSQCLICNLSLQLLCSYLYRVTMARRWRRANSWSLGWTWLWSRPKRWKIPHRPYPWFHVTCNLLPQGASIVRYLQRAAQFPAIPCNVVRCYKHPKRAPARSARESSAGGESSVTAYSHGSQHTLQGHTITSLVIAVHQSSESA